MATINIHHVTRIEGHASITIHLDDAGKVADTQFHVTQIRGFEKFVEGRPYYEMPAITARICGICPVSHLLASSKACDEIMAVRIPATAAKLRELSTGADRAVARALASSISRRRTCSSAWTTTRPSATWPACSRSTRRWSRTASRLRKFGQQVIERLGRERVHPSWTVPGGVNAPLDPAAREKTLEEWPEALAILQRTLELWKDTLDAFPDEIATFSNFPDHVLRHRLRPTARCSCTTATCASGTPPARSWPTRSRPPTTPTTSARRPWPTPTSRRPTTSRSAWPRASTAWARWRGSTSATTSARRWRDAELEEMRQRLGRIVQSSFHYHYARLIEAIYALERMKELLDDPGILDTKVRAHAGVNDLEGVGIIEAPRGTLIHHYKVNEDGAMTWANLIVATGHNNLAIGRGVHQVATRFVDGNKIQEGAVNRVSALVRAYDPCLSCSTHPMGRRRSCSRCVGPTASCSTRRAPSRLSFPG